MTNFEIADTDMKVFETADADTDMIFLIADMDTRRTGRGHACPPISDRVDNFIKFPDQIHLNNSTDDLVFEIRFWQVIRNLD